MFKSGHISDLPGNLANMSVSTPNVEKNYTLNLTPNAAHAAMILVSPRMRWFVTVVYIGTVVHIHRYTII